jgi:DNA-binding Lrp family transcriptional regulator
MVTAIVLINTNAVRIHEIGRQLSELPEVQNTYLVAGEYELICVIKAADNQTLSQIITRNIVHVEGVERTKTLLALETIK